MNLLRRITKWLNEIFQRERKSNEQRALGMKEMKINGITVFIWAAVDLDDGKVIAPWVSFGRSGIEAKSFLKKVKRVCTGSIAEDLH